MPYRNYLITTGILMLMLAIGYWADDGSLRPVAQQRSLLIRKDADYFLVDAEIREYGTNGQLKYTLESQSITHYPHNDNTLLQTPTLLNFSEPGQVIHSNAQSGKLLPGGKDLELWDNVVMTQTHLAHGAKVRMDTDFITIYSDQDRADTDRPVLITSNTGKTRAIGMTALYQQGIIQLKSRVRGVHDIQQ